MRWLRQLCSDVRHREFWIGFASAFDLSGRLTRRLMAERRASYRQPLPTFDELLPKVCAVTELTYEQGAKVFDISARRLFGVSGEEWLRRYDEGGWRDAGHTKIVSMEMLIPFVRSTAQSATRSSSL